MRQFPTVPPAAIVLYWLVEGLPMVQGFSRWHAFENAWIASHKPDYAENVRLVDGMYELARALGQFRDEDALDGVEKNIRLVALLNRVQNAP
jgi:hypothetical protein